MEGSISISRDLIVYADLLTFIMGSVHCSVIFIACNVRLEINTCNNVKSMILPYSAAMTSYACLIAIHCTMRSCLHGPTIHLGRSQVSACI